MIYHYNVIEIQKIIVLIYYIPGHSLQNIDKVPYIMDSVTQSLTTWIL